MQFTNIKLRFLIVAKAFIFSLLALVYFSGSVGASHWPHGMRHNSANSSLSRGYFTQRNVTSVGPAVLPSHNYNGSACTGYTFSEWQAAGSPTGSQLFAIPNSEVWAGNQDSGNNTRKQQLYDHLRRLYNQGSNSGNCLQRQKFFGVSFIVNTMLGITSNGVNNNANIGSGKWNQFRDRLMQSDIYLTSSNNFARRENTFIARRDYLSGLSGTAARDVAVHHDFKAEPTILIRRGSSTGPVLYALKRRCANPTGNFLGLPDPPPPAPITCGNLTVLPSADPEPGEPFRVRVSFNVGGGPGPDPTYDIYLTLSAAGLNNRNIGGGSVARGSSGVETSPEVTIPNPGQYEGFYRVVATDTTPATLICRFGVGDPLSPVRVVSLPYFKAYGGDMHAGSSFRESDGTCSANQQAGMLGFNRPGSGSGPFRGSGTQLATFALGYIRGVSSGQITSPNTPRDRTFANTSLSYNNYGTNTYGGGMYASGNAVCAPDYYGEMPAGAANLGPSTNANRPKGDYRRNGNLTITGGNFGLGANNGATTFYVDGDVTISGNIRYANGQYSSIEHIPSFRLIVRGNIYVSPGVSRLDGIYIAQPDPSSPSNTGRFYSCWPGGTPSAATINGICRTSGRLTVNGALIAERLKFTRSNGTRSQASVDERHNNAGSVGNPAEVIIFTPDVWLNSGFSGSNEFDSITALPPVL